MCFRSMENTSIRALEQAQNVRLKLPNQFGHRIKQTASKDGCALSSRFLGNALTFLGHQQFAVHKNAKQPKWIADRFEIIKDVHLFFRAGDYEGFTDANQQSDLKL